MAFAGWHGQEESMSKIYIDALKFDDYVMADYQDASHNPINFYVAYYGSQRKGASAHSPRSCIPGGGWQITSLTQKAFKGVKIGDVPLKVNRAVIQKGNSSQLVYYWFQERGRVITNEYMVKWFLFWDALTKNRTDGALVRLMAPLTEGESISQADALMTGFIKDMAPRLEAYIPGS